jgi:hypothetical protein
MQTRKPVRTTAARSTFQWHFFLSQDCISLINYYLFKQLEKITGLKKSNKSEKDRRQRWMLDEVQQDATRCRTID